MSFTQDQIEKIAYHIRSVGFNFDDTFDDEQFGLVATCVLEALDIEIEQ